MIVGRLFRLLKEIAKEENCKINKMDAHNLAIVFSPTLMRKKRLSPERALNDTKLATKLIEIMIDKYTDIFTRRESVAHSYIRGESCSAFYKSLRIADVELAQTRIKETNQLNEIFEISKEHQCKPEDVDINMFASFCNRKAAFHNGRKQIDMVWGDVFKNPVEKRNSTHELDKNEEVEELLESQNALSHIPTSLRLDENTSSQFFASKSDKAAEELVDKIVNSSFEEPSKPVDGFLERVNSSTTMDRHNSFQSALEMLDEVRMMLQKAADEMQQ